MTTLLGKKTDELNLNSMHVKLCISFILLAPLLWGAPPHESLALQEMRGSFQELNYRFNSCQTELQILSERCSDLEAKVKTVSKSDPHTNRLASLEATQQSLADDIKSLKSHLNKTNETLHTCQKQLASVDKQLTTDIAALKTSLKSMIALLKGGTSEDYYIVKSGDSLGKIALENRTSTKKLKEYNNLHSDTIFVGQKLAIP